MGTETLLDAEIFIKLLKIGPEGGDCIILLLYHTSYPIYGDTAVGLVLVRTKHAGSKLSRTSISQAGLLSYPSHTPAPAGVCQVQHVTAEPYSITR